MRDRITWWQLDGRPFFDGETEPCINGSILAAGAYFGEASHRLVNRLLSEQFEDGGWNCEAQQSSRSSFHTVTEARVRAHAPGSGLLAQRRRRTR